MPWALGEQKASGGGPRRRPGQGRIGKAAATRLSPAKARAGRRPAQQLEEEIRRLDDALMRQSARCTALEDELQLAQEDLSLARATNNDLRAELREKRKQQEALSEERTQNYDTIKNLGGAKIFLEDDHQKLLDEVSALRASEQRLTRQVKRLTDENQELRSYWEDSFEDLQRRRIESITPQMLADRKHKGNVERSQKREEILKAQNRNLTDLLTETQRGHFTHLGRLVQENNTLKENLSAAQKQSTRYLGLLEGTSNNPPPYSTYDFLDLDNVRSQLWMPAAARPAW